MQVVSIVTTTRNRRVLLEKTLLSVLAQEYPSVEHIVIDAASEDDTVALLKKYESVYRDKQYMLKWTSERDSGQGEGMNKGLKMVMGEFVCLLNDDDTLLPGALSRYAKPMVENKEIDFVYGPGLVVDFEGARQVDYNIPHSVGDVLNKGISIPQSACLFRKALLDRSGGFDQSLHHVAEFELFLRFWKQGARCLYISEPMQAVLEHGGRKTTMSLTRSWQETKMVIFRNGGSYFSRFYLLYCKNVYFGWFFDCLQQKLPGLYRGIKKIFNSVVR